MALRPVVTYYREPCDELYAMLRAKAHIIAAGAEHMASIGAKSAELDRLSQEDLYQRMKDIISESDNSR